MGWTKGKKRGPQAPAHTANAVAARAKAVEGRVWVSRNDAAYLALARNCHERITALQAKKAELSSTSDSPTETVGETLRRLWDCETQCDEAIENELERFNRLQQAWANGEDVLIAKLSQE